jgi:hypothetical protein
MEHFVSCPGSRWQVFGEIKRQLVASSEAADTNSSLLETKDTKLQQQEPIVWRMVDSTNKKKNLHLFLADRGKIRWGRLASRSADKRKGLLVNYFRAFDSLTNKVALCKSVRYWAASAKQRDATFMPESYVLKPTNLEAQAGGGERTEFLAAIAQETQQEDPTKNIWIVKSDKGAKGDDIFIGRSADQVFTFIDSKFVIPKQSDTIAITAAEAEAEAKLPPWKRKTGLKKKPKSQASWIVQRYIGNPFLLSGRKFDIRVWVLLTSTSYQIYVYNEAVFRTSSVEY